MGNNSSKQDYKNNSCTQFARESVGLCPFYNSYPGFVRISYKIAQTILKNHIGFTIHVSAIKLCFIQR